MHGCCPDLHLASGFGFVMKYLRAILPNYTATERALECPCHISIYAAESPKLIEMRLLTLLATTVLLAACVHEKDDFTLFYPETGASLIYYLGGGADKEIDEDPWHTILEKFGTETSHTGKSKDDPWDTITCNFSSETAHTGKVKAAGFVGVPIAEMMFISLERGEDRESRRWEDLGSFFETDENVGNFLVLVEVRGKIGRFRFVSASGGELENGRSLFAVGLPEGWSPGLVLRGDAYLLDTKKMLPLMGAVVWELDRILNSVPNL